MYLTLAPDRLQLFSMYGFTHASVQETTLTVMSEPQYVTHCYPPHHVLTCANINCIRIPGDGWGEGGTLASKPNTAFVIKKNKVGHYYRVRHNNVAVPAERNVNITW